MRRKHEPSKPSTKLSSSAALPSLSAHREANKIVGRSDEAQYITDEYIHELEAEMLAAADGLEFERAAAIRDRITQLRDSMGKKVNEVEVESFQRGKLSKRRGGKKGAKVPRPKRG